MTQNTPKIAFLNKCLKTGTLTNQNDARSSHKIVPGCILIRIAAINQGKEKKKTKSSHKLNGFNENTQVKLGNCNQVIPSHTGIVMVLNTHVVTHCQVLPTKTEFLLLTTVILTASSN